MVLTHFGRPCADEFIRIHPEAEKAEGQEGTMWFYRHKGFRDGVLSQLGELLADELSGKPEENNLREYYDQGFEEGREYYQNPPENSPLIKACEKEKALR